MINTYPTLQPCVNHSLVVFLLRTDSDSWDILVLLSKSDRLRHFPSYLVGNIWCWTVIRLNRSIQDNILGPHLFTYRDLRHLNVTIRPWRTTLAPILIGLVNRLRRDQWLILLGKITRCGALRQVIPRRAAARFPFLGGGSRALPCLEKRWRPAQRSGMEKKLSSIFRLDWIWSKI